MNILIQTHGSFAGSKKITKVLENRNIIILGTQKIMSCIRGDKTEEMSVIGHISEIILQLEWCLEIFHSW